MIGPQFLRFVAVGGFAAAVNVGSGLLFRQFVPYGAAIVLAYLVGMSVAFTLNRLFVFERSGRHHREEYLRFGLVNLAGLAQVWLVSEGLARLVFPAIGLTWQAKTVAHVMGVAAPILTSYFGHKHFSFAPRATAES